MVVILGYHVGYQSVYRPPGYGYIPEDNFIRYSKKIKVTMPEPVQEKSVKDYLKPSVQAEPKENVNHPKHYNSHPSGVECIDIIRWYDFNIGSAIKYLWRHGLKVTDNRSEEEMSIEDLKKAVWYIQDEIAMLEKASLNKLVNTI